MILIKGNKYTIFGYLSNRKVMWNEPTLHCKRCGMGLNYAYTYIIKTLRRAKLLHPDYKELCCSCYKWEEYYKTYIWDDEK